MQIWSHGQDRLHLCDAFRHFCSRPLLISLVIHIGLQLPPEERY